MFIDPNKKGLTYDSFVGFLFHNRKSELLLRLVSDGN